MPGDRPLHIPLRSCVVCRRKLSKRELIRLVRTAAGAVQVDERARAPGRGAYLCHDPACWERASAGDSLARALRTTLSPQDRAALQARGRGLETATGSVMARGTATVATATEGDPR